MRPRRTPVLVVITILLVAGGVADRASRPRPALSPAAANRAVMPTAAPADALSSTWFCVGATAAAGSAADGVVSVANPSDGPASGTVTVVPVTGETRTVPVAIAPQSVTRVALRDVTTAPHAAALVDLDEGRAVAELVVQGPADSDATPCSSRASNRWFFADGATAKDASLVMSLFNPFPEDAIVDLSFSTDQGRASPAAFRPIVVPARTLVVREIGDHVRRRNSISTALSVRAGRVVAAQTQTRTAPGKAGTSVALGAPSLGSVWYFPAGLVGDGVAEHFAVFNPGATEATVLFQVILDEGVVEDFERSVPANGRLDVVLNEEVGVPRGVGHSTTVRSLDGRPVVVSRTQETSSPSPQAGRTDTLGSRRAASSWLFAAGGASDVSDESVVITNPGPRPATVSISGLAGEKFAAVESLRAIPVGAGRRVVVRIRDHVAQDPLPLLVKSSVPVVAERVLNLSSPPGVWASVGIPMG